MAILGIDLGTTNSLACVYRQHECIMIPNRLKEFLTPSVVSLDEEHHIIVGKWAKERLVTHPDKTVANFKRFMGTDKKYKLGDQEFTPEELSSFILRSLIEDAKAYLQEEIEEIIVSVPAYFNDDQRWATKSAGKLAGVKIERIINEPSAAALSLHMASQGERTYLVVDFGGGTLDISIVDAFDNIIEIVSVAGNNHLGGEDFNRLLIDEFLSSLKIDERDLDKTEKEMLYRQAEICKRAFNHADEVWMEVVIKNEKKAVLITYDKFNQLAAHLLMRLELPIQKALADANDKIDTIHDIILVGGSCKMRMIKEYLQHLLQWKIGFEENPDMAVAYGCGIIAGIKERNEAIRDVLLSDICPFTLGVELEGGMFSPIIERNTILPASREEIYQTMHLGQKKIKFDIYQGESMKAKDNLQLGSIQIDVPSNPDEHELCKVRFTYDINGLLEIDIIALSTQEHFHKLIIGKKNRMTSVQIAKKLDQLQKLKLHPRDEEKNQYLVARGSRLFEERLGEERQNIQYLSQTFIKAMETQDTHQIQRAYEQLKQYLDTLEGKETERGLMS